MSVSSKIFLLVMICASQVVLAQDYDGLKGYSIYKKYDKSQISPDLRRKHSISIGGVLEYKSPINNADEYSVGFHLGYNYLVLKKRKRIVGVKEKWRDEVKFGFGLHLSVLTKGEYYLMLNYFNPLFSLKGKFFSIYFINEYGLGFHQPMVTENTAKEKIQLNFSLEPFRLRFGKSGFNFLLKINYDMKNNFFGKERMNVGFMGGLRYYFIKK